MRRIFIYCSVLTLLLSGCAIGQNRIATRDPVQTSIVTESSYIKPSTPKPTPVIKIPQKKSFLNIPYTVISIADGDTITVQKKGEEQKKIRMIGLDTPEKFTTRTGYIECYGEEASAYANEILSGQIVYLDFDKSQGKFDKYGRTLAHVFLSNEFNYQELVIKNGYGFSYVYSKKSKYYDIYKQAENFAQLNNLGVWKYCDGKRKAKVAVITATQKPFIKKKCNAYVKGNISYRTGVKIYHVPGCDNYIYKKSELLNTFGISVGLQFLLIAVITTAFSYASYHYFEKRFL